MLNKWLHRRRYRLDAVKFIAWVDRGWPWPEDRMSGNVWCIRWVEHETLMDLYVEAKKFIKHV